MHTGHRLAAVLICLLITGSALRAQPPATASVDPELRAHVDAFFAALASGQPDTFEAMARAHCTPAFLERRPALQRAEMIRRLHEDFGTMTLDAIRVTDEGVVLEIRGSTGMRGRADLGVEVASPRRIDRFGVRVEAGAGGERPPLPALPISGAMNETELGAALDTHLAALARSGEFSGAVLVARDGRQIFARGYGEADRDAHIANTPATRFNIGSINKSFTQIAVAQLIAAGRVKSTDTIGGLLPDYPNADARAATVQQLLDHRGGIADFFGPTFAATPKATLRTNADYFRLVAPQALTFAPGTRRSYCNGCYIVLGEIIARVAGQPYEAYIVEHVFAPAGMSRTGFVRPDPRPADVAQGYTTRGDSGGVSRSNADMIGAGGSAAGGAYSTVTDLLAYVAALRAHRLLDKADAGRLLGGEGTADALALAGGAPGLNALVHASGDVVVVVLANLDPPHAERLGEALSRQLAR